jgi:hypothetical protein
MGVRLAMHQPVVLQLPQLRRQHLWRRVWHQPPELAEPHGAVLEVVQDSAKTLGITRDSVSRLEKRSDLLLSMLRKTVKAMGGSLSLVAKFRDRPPVVLSGLAEDNPPDRAAGRKSIMR